MPQKSVLSAKKPNGGWGDPWSVVLVDTDCRLCTSAARRICLNDPLRKFAFASQESAFARNLLCCRTIPETAWPDSLILVEQGRIFTHSTAVLRIARQMRFPWWLLYGLIVVPRPIRDGAYRLLAAWRYRLFGRSSSREPLTADCADRFVH